LQGILSPDSCGLNRAESGAATGVLTPPKDAVALAAGIERLLADERLRAQLGYNAARDAADRFDLDRQATEYLGWYCEMMETHPRITFPGEG
jgi:glycosyltransferase involved in cell wall biosynthesis